jgi:hypothetical protein
VEAIHDVLKVIFAIVTGVGMLFLIIVPIAGVVTLSDGLRARTLRRVPARSFSELRAGKGHPSRVVVRATAVGEPGVEYRAPLSGAACLWFRLTLRRVDKVATESGFDYSVVTVWSYETGQKILCDDGSGIMDVDVSLLEKPILDGDRAATVEQSQPSLTIHGDNELARLDLPDAGGIRRALRPTPKTEEFLLVEEVVRPGAVATVFGRPVHRGGQLILARGRGYRVGVTGRTRDELVDNLSRENREMLWGIRASLIIAAIGLLCGLGGIQLTRLIPI